jgi:hypothetical protein
MRAAASYFDEPIIFSIGSKQSEGYRPNMLDVKMKKSGAPGEI